MAHLPDIITKARARLLVRAPFLGSIALGLGWVEAPEVGTMATDGRHVWFNRAWCEEYGVEKIIGVIAHEVLHVVNKHHLRRGDRDPSLWNQAADLLINRLLEEDDYLLPACGLFDRERQFAGLPTETIYTRLLQQQPPRSSDDKPNESAKGSSSAPKGGPYTREGHDGADVESAKMWGEVRDLLTTKGKTLSPSERRQAEADLDIRIRQAAVVAKRAGKFSEVTRELVRVSTDRVDWRDKFRMAFDGTLRGEASWSRPNRRFIQHGLYLPGWRRTGAGRIAFVLDTSGSISERELSVYTAAVLGILEETGPECVALIQCDTEVRHVEYLQPGESFDQIEVVGRGGTRFQPAFDWIAGSDLVPSIIVYATDLRSADAPEDPGIPVLWLTPTRGRAVSFGDVIEVSP